MIFDISNLWISHQARRLWRETDGGILQGVQCGDPDNCGCVKCEVFFDDFGDASIDAGWSQESGSWSESSGVISTSSTNAVLAYDTGGGSAVLRASTYVTPPTSGDVARLIIGYVDTSNYWFSEITAGGSGSGLFRLYFRSSGSNSLKVTASLTIEPGEQHFMQLCVTESGTVHSKLVTSDAETKYQFSLAGTPLSTEDVVGIGTGGTVASSISFDNFSVERSDEADCTPCTTPCGIYGDSTPYAWDVTLPTLVDNNCGDCDDVYGGSTYRVYGPCNRCNWGAEIAACTWTQFPFSSNQPVYLNVEVDLGTPPVSVLVNLGYLEPGNVAPCPFDNGGSASAYSILWFNAVVSDPITEQDVSYNSYGVVSPCRGDATPGAAHIVPVY